MFSLKKTNMVQLLTNNKNMNEMNRKSVSSEETGRGEEQTTKKLRI